MQLYRVVARDFRATPADSMSATAVRYFADLGAACGVPDAPVPAGLSVTAMADAMVRVTEPVDVVVVAYAVPDAEPLQSAACRLAETVPGAPLSFGVTDHGAVTSFIALRLAALCGTRHGVVFAADCAAAAMLMVRVGDEDRGHAVRIVAGIGPADAGQVIAAELAGDPVRRPVTVIAGDGLRDLPGMGADVVRAAAGMPCTGLWARLAALPPRAGCGRRVVVADYDPGTRCLGTLTLDPAEEDS